MKKSILWMFAGILVGALPSALMMHLLPRPNVQTTQRPTSLVKKAHLEAQPMRAAPPSKSEPEISSEASLVSERVERIQKLADEIVFNRKRGSDQLPAPQFTQSIPNEIEPSADGAFFVSWATVAGADSYRVVILDAKGNRISSRSTRGNHLYVKMNSALQPGDYWLALLSEGRGGEGKLSEKRRLKLRQNWTNLQQ